RQRIAGINRHVGDRSPLHAVRRTIAALRIRVARRVAIVVRIRINDAANGAVLVGELGLETTPAAAVPRDDDPALDADAATIEFLVVVGHALVHVNEFGGYVAVGAVRV